MYSLTETLTFTLNFLARKISVFIQFQPIRSLKGLTRGGTKAEMLWGASEQTYKMGKISLYLGNFLNKGAEKSKQEHVQMS